MLNGSHVEVGRQCAEVGYLHPPCESQDLTQVIRLGGGGEPLPSGPSCQPIVLLFFVLGLLDTSHLVA